MALHRTLVQRGLAVEEHIVAVNHVAVHDIALAQVNHVGVDVAQRDHALVVLDEDRLGAGVADAVAHIHHEAVAVVGCDDFGFREVGGDFFGHAEFVDVDVGVGRDDGTGREVYALAHEVAAHAPRFRAETGFQGLERATRPLGGGGHALDVVVHVGRDVVFEVCRHLFNVVAGLTAIDLLAQFLVAAHNVDEFVGEVVVHALVVVHDDGRADREGRNSEHGADHPRGATVLRVEPENANGGVAEALEASEDHLGLNRDELGVGVDGTCLLSLEGADGALNLFDLAQHDGLADGAGDCLLGALRLHDCSHSIFADGRKAVHAGEFGLEVSRLGSAAGVDRHDVERRAVQADCVEDLDRKLEELVEVDGAREGDVTKVTLALEVGVLAGRADLAALDDAEAGVKDAAGDGVTPLVRLVRNDLDDRSPQNLFGRRYAELYAYDRHCILICCASNIFLDPFFANIYGLRRRCCRRAPPPDPPPETTAGAGASAETASNF